MKLLQLNYYYNYTLFLRMQLCAQNALNYVVINVLKNDLGNQRILALLAGDLLLFFNEH